MTFLGLSYSPSMRLVLFVSLISGACVQNWTAIQLARALYDEAFETKKKVIALTLIETALYNGIVFVAAMLCGFRKFDSLLEAMLVIPNPVLCLAMYAIVTKLWHLPSYRLTSIIRHVYLYTLMVSTTGLLIARICISNWGESRYLSYCLVNVIFLGICVLLYQICSRIIQRKQFTIHIPNNMPVGKTRLLSLSLVECACAYSATILMLQIFRQSVLGDLIVSACLVLFLVCDILLTYKAALKCDLDNKNAYINNLVDTVDRYANFKQDINEILDTYDTYLENEDQDAIVCYHESLMGKTTQTLQSFNVTQRMAQNPSLVALLQKKTDYAHQMNVSLVIPMLCPLEDMYIEDFDLGRLLGNLLNNAIEAASQSAAKKVTLSIAQKNPTRKLIVLSNSTAANVDVESVTQHGVTTKENHMGIGLTQVRNIVAKYNNCMLNFTCENNEFFVYMELWQQE